MIVRPLRASAPVLLASFAFALVVFAGGVASAQSETAAGADGPPSWAYQLAHDLMSPYCPGRTLSACPSPQAAELRQWILFQAASGQSREDIEASLYDQFGDQILSAPKAEGWGLSAYVVPVLGFLLGGGLVAFLLRRLVTGTVDAGPAVSASARGAAPGREGEPEGEPLSDWELEKIVDEELARL